MYFVLLQFGPVKSHTFLTIHYNLAFRSASIQFNYLSILSIFSYTEVTIHNTEEKICHYIV